MNTKAMNGHKHIKHTLSICPTAYPVFLHATSNKSAGTIPNSR
jgi:hypothetical protein